MTSLIPRLVYGSLDLTDAPYALEFGRDFGAAENIYTILSSQLADGEVVTSDRSSNRQMVFTVIIEGSDQALLADAEAALIEECGRAGNTLSFDPGDGLGKVTVFETFRAQPVPIYDDDADMALMRRFTVTIPALPFPRSEAKITDAAGAAPSSAGTVLNNCESTAGWGTWAYTATTPTVDTATFHEGAGSIVKDAGSYSLTAVDSDGQDYAGGLSADKLEGLALSTGTGGYMSIWVKTDWTSTLRDQYGSEVTSGLKEMYVKYASGYGATGAQADMKVSITAAEVAADGFVRYVWQAPPGESVTRLRTFVEQYRWGHSTVVPKVRYDAISLSTTATTDAQIVKTFTVEGSVRAPGALLVASPDPAVALGAVLVTTVPEIDVAAGFRPDMRRWVTAGATTADTTALGGSYFTGGAGYASTLQFEAPVSMLRPGNYSVVALAKSAASPLAAGVETQLIFSGVATGESSAVEVSVPNPSTVWRLVPVGTVRIPEVTNPGSGAKIRVRLKGSNTQFAEVFLIPEAADFTIASCGEAAVSASGSSSHLWVESPSPDQPQGGWWRGPTADGTDRRKLNMVTELTKPGLHVFKPGRMLCFLTATKASGPTVNLTYHPHWHTHAAL